MTSIDKPIFITGSTGTGKTMIIQSFIKEARANDKNPVTPIELNFSAQTESIGTQQNIDAKL